MSEEVVNEKRPADEPKGNGHAETPAPKEPPKGEPSPLLKRLALLALPIAAIALFVLFSARGSVRFDRGVELVSITIPRTAAKGGTIPIDLRYRASQPLSPEHSIFLHIESTGPAAEKNCRMVADRLVPAGLASAWVAGAEVVHHVDVGVPTSCKADDFRVYTGIWHTREGDRLKLIDPGTLDDRLPAADIEVVDEKVSEEPRVISGPAIKRHARASLFLPWIGWGGGVLAMAALAVVLARRVQEKDDLAKDALPREAKVFAFLVPATWFVLGLLVVLEFVKDDAYISFRYAHNFVKGKGLVFNPGDRLEGFTNFLWTMILVPFEGLGWDLFQVCEVLGTILTFCVIVLMLQIATRWDQARKDLSFAWSTVWLATSSSWVLWSKSGLEQALAALLPLSAAFFIWRAGEETEPKKKDKLAITSGVLMALGCMTRPEIHLLAFIIGSPLLVEAIRTRKLPKIGLIYAGVIVGMIVPFHLWRHSYYHSWLPNTFYVKTGAGSQVWRAGLDQLHEMFRFNDLGYVVLLVPFAFVTRKRLMEKLVALAVTVAFMLYIVKVGVDEMQWFRLYLPALPFLLLLAGLGARNLLDAVGTFLSPKDPAKSMWLLAAMGWGAVLYAGSQSFQFTYKELHGFDGHGDLAGTFHPDLGKFIVRHERPGGLVAFQDMGSTPYHAPDVDFLDFIGLTEGRVAHARHDYGLHAFVPTEGKAKKAYDAEMRDYFFQRSPEWTILTVYVPREQEQSLADRFDRDPGPGAIGNLYFNNSYQFGIWGDQRFHERYVHVRTWQRSRGYYLSLFRRKDLWEQVPREVVFAANEPPPPGITGPKVDFDRDIKMLGGVLDPTSTLERHEVFITTWWKVPGPMEKDITIFVHVTKQGFQAPLDHPPGDWMYPADRWRPGDVIEDRVLFQLPPFTMKPGKYDVYVGLYRKSTGERIKILNGGGDGTGRVHVGSFEVKRLQPLIHQLIPPTRVEVMRKYPDRIIDSHKPQG
ncbi:MAG: hypothetical protein ACXVEF_03665 [Polyangiales bacterium]